MEYYALRNHDGNIPPWFVRYEYGEWRVFAQNIDPDDATVVVRRPMGSRSTWRGAMAFVWVLAHPLSTSVNDLYARTDHRGM